MSSKPIHLAIVFLLILVAACDSNETPVNTEEVIRPDETQQAEEAIVHFQKLLEEYKTGYVSRGAHAKGHACVKARFKVLDEIAGQYQHGLFHQPGNSYAAWIRFSNGHFDLSVSNDQKKDARGMAIKVMDPPGVPLEIAANGIPAQDFLMTNSPVFFIKTVDDYNSLVAEPADLAGFVFNGPNPFKWRIREMLLARKTLTRAPSSLLASQYYSITAYKLGPHNIKFSARPCEANQLELDYNGKDPDFLRKHLEQELEQGDACFDFMVQLQDSSKYMPIEDPTVEWKKSDSPFIPVARVTIPSQSFSNPSQIQFCEDLSFAPWHALEAHRPIGHFNRIRRHVYKASSDYRHARNKTKVPDTL